MGAFDHLIPQQGQGENAFAHLIPQQAAQAAPAGPTAAPQAIDPTAPAAPLDTGAAAPAGPPGAPAGPDFRDPRDVQAQGGIPTSSALQEQNAPLLYGEEAMARGPRADQELAKAMERGIKGLGQQGQALRFALNTSEVRQATRTLAAFKDIDQGKPLPRSITSPMAGEERNPAVEAYYASDPNTRAQMRDQYRDQFAKSEAGQRLAYAAWDAYRKQIQQQQARVPSLTNVHDAADFRDFAASWLGENGIYMVPIVMSAMTGPAGFLAVSGGMNLAGNVNAVMEHEARKQQPDQLAGLPAGAEGLLRGQGDLSQGGQHAEQQVRDVVGETGEALAQSAGTIAGISGAQTVLGAVVPSAIQRTAMAPGVNKVLGSAISEGISKGGIAGGAKVALGIVGKDAAGQALTMGGMDFLTSVQDSILYSEALFTPENIKRWGDAAAGAAMLGPVLSAGSVAGHVRAAREQTIAAPWKKVEHLFKPETVGDETLYLAPNGARITPDMWEGASERNRRSWITPNVSRRTTTDSGVIGAEGVQPVQEAAGPAGPTHVSPVPPGGPEGMAGEAAPGVAPTAGPRKVVGGIRVDEDLTAAPAPAEERPPTFEALTPTEQLTGTKAEERPPTLEAPEVEQLTGAPPPRLTSPLLEKLEGALERTTDAGVGQELTKQIAKERTRLAKEAQADEWHRLAMEEPDPDLRKQFMDRAVKAGIPVEHVEAAPAPAEPAHEAPPGIHVREGEAEHVQAAPITRQEVAARRAWMRRHGLDEGSAEKAAQVRAAIEREPERVKQAASLPEREFMKVVKEINRAAAAAETARDKLQQPVQRRPEHARGGIPKVEGEPAAEPVAKPAEAAAGGEARVRGEPGHRTAEAGADVEKRPEVRPAGAERRREARTVDEALERAGIQTKEKAAAKEGPPIAPAEVERVAELAARGTPAERARAMMEEAEREHPPEGPQHKVLSPEEMKTRAESSKQAAERKQREGLRAAIRKRLEAIARAVYKFGKGDEVRGEHGNRYKILFKDVMRTAGGGYEPSYRVRAVNGLEFDLPERRIKSLETKYKGVEGDIAADQSAAMEHAQSHSEVMNTVTESTRKQFPKAKFSLVESSLDDPHISPDRRRALEMAAAIAREHGVEDVVFIKHAGKDKVTRGFFDPRYPDKVFIATDVDHTVLSVTGHEFFHNLEYNHHDLAAKFEKALDGLVDWDKHFADYSAQLRNAGRVDPPTRKGTRSELMGDIVGDFWSNRSLQEKLAAANPDLYSKLAAVWTHFVDKTIKALRAHMPFGSTKYIHDLEKVRDAVATLMADVKRRHEEGVELERRIGAGYSQFMGAPERGPPFYSALKRGIEGINAKSMKAEDWKKQVGALKGVKKEEVEWTGINEFLDLIDKVAKLDPSMRVEPEERLMEEFPGGRITKEQMTNFMDDNGVRVEESMLRPGSEIKLPEGFKVIEDEETGRQEVQLRLKVPAGEGRGFINREFIGRGDTLGAALDDIAESLRRDIHKAGTVIGSTRTPESEKAAWRAAQTFYQEQLHRVETLSIDAREGKLGTTKYGEYTEGGPKKGYRELLLRLPSKVGRLEKQLLDLNREYEQISDAIDEGWTQELQDRADANWKKRKELSEERDRQRAAEFTASHHQGEVNVLAHIRFNERVDADGKKVLYIEEVQSDWAEKGRKKGFLDPKGLVDLANEHSRAMQLTSDRYDAMQAALRELSRFHRGVSGTRLAEIVHQSAVDVGVDKAIQFLREKTLTKMPAEPGVDPRERVAALVEPVRKWIEASIAEGEVEARVEAAQGREPIGPYVGNTSAWVGLAMKRMIRYAAENGFDRIAWTDGNIQADRYGLTRVLNEIDVQPNGIEFRGEPTRTVMLGMHDGTTMNLHVNEDGKVVSGSGRGSQQLVGHGLDEIVGAEMADRIMGIEHTGPPQDPTYGTYEIRGEQLKMGGQGMRSFYGDAEGRVLDANGNQVVDEKGRPVKPVMTAVTNDILRKLGGGAVHGEAKMDLGMSKTPSENRAYEGPNYSVDDAREKYLAYRNDFPDLVTRNLTTQYKYVMQAMENGHSFAEAIRMHGSSALANIFGGELISREKQRPQPGFDITDSMRNTALAGQPQFKGVKKREPPSKRSSVALRTGEEKLKLPAGKIVTRMVAQALEDRTRKNSGRIEYNDFSDKAKEKIAQAMADEVEHDMTHPQAGKSGLGWYSHDYPASVDRLSRVYPELKDSQPHKDLFSALLATFSNGQTVATNARMAIQAYDAITRQGTAMTDVAKFGANRETIHALEGLRDVYREYGSEGAKAYLLEEVSIADMNAAMRKQGIKPPSDYPADMKMPRAAIIMGPKIGAFYANLTGAHGYLTMDRWWSRSFNRLRGQLVEEPTQSGLDNLRSLLEQEQRRSYAGLDDEHVMQAAVPYQYDYAQRGYKNGTPLEKAANTVLKAATTELLDAPRGPNERRFMIDTAKRTQEILAERGIKLTLADVQAAEWYYEKKLYAEMGARDSGTEGYDEAINEHAKGTGLDNRPARSVDQLVHKGVGQDAGREDVEPEQAHPLEGREAERAAREAHVPARPELSVDHPPNPPIGEGPTVDPVEAQIQHAMAPPPGGMAALDGEREIRQWLFDKFDRVTQVTEAQERVSGPVADTEDIRLAEKGVAGRMQNEGEKLANDYLEPLADAIKAGAKVGLKVSDFDDYRMALHAPERNATMKGRDPQGRDGLSGMTDAQAARTLASFTPDQMRALQAADPIINGLRDQNLDRLVNAGLITAQARAQLRAQWRNYVPLKTIDEEHQKFGIGQGFQLWKTDIKTAFGRQSKAGSPIANLITDAMQGIVRAEKARVDQVIWNVAQRQEMGNILREYDPDNPPPSVMDKVMDQATGQWKEVVNTRKLEQQSIHLMINGEGKRILVGDESLRDALSKSGSIEALPKFLEKVGRLTSVLGRTLTEWNPSFTIPNAIKDAVAAAIRTRGIKGMSTMRVLAGIPSAWKAIATEKMSRTGVGQRYGIGQNAAADAYRLYKELGGKTGAYGIEHPADILRKLSVDGIDLGYSDYEAGPISRTFAKGKTILEGLSAANEILEYATRLSAFNEARRAGYSDQRAMEIGKEITVNFNRSGKAGRAMNSLFVFFNAALQGLHGTIEFGRTGSAGVIQSGAVEGQKTRRAMYALAAAGFVMQGLNEFLGGTDDDTGEDKIDQISDFVADNNMSFMPLGFRLALAPEYAFCWAIGRRLYRAMSKGNYEKEAMGIAGAIAGAVSPIRTAEQGASGVAGTAAKTITPSMALPFAEIAMNEDFMGKSIYPEQRQGDAEQPYYVIHKPGTSKLAIAISEMINTVGGGDEAEPGWFQQKLGPLTSPEAIEHLAKAYTGGLGATVMQSKNVINKLTDPEAAENEPLEPSNIPVINRFALQPSRGYTGRRYHELATDVQGYKAAIRRKRDGLDIPDPSIEETLSQFESAEEKLHPLFKQLRKAQEQDDQDLVRETRELIEFEQKRVIEAYTSARRSNNPGLFDRFRQ